MLIDVDNLRSRYYKERPDPSNPLERVAFGTSGHRGSAARRSFNEAHILAVVQAVCERRAADGVTGPLFLGKDTHALSEPAQETALGVLAANGVDTRYAAGGADTPTPVISHAILTHNRGRAEGLADGIVITPSHNPPEDGGIKYNPPSGGPADVDITGWIEDRANQILATGGSRRTTIDGSSHLRPHDFIRPYVEDLRAVVDLDAIRDARIVIGADPLGGANLAYWEPIASTYGLDLTVVNPARDPRFAFMPLDHDGKIRMDCSSPYAMANLVKLKDQFQIAFGNDADSDRHGIVVPGTGLMNPNHVLAVAASYLFTERHGWRSDAAIGKTVVSSALIDRVAARLGRRLVEVPVGFKFFVGGLLDGSLGFGGEESAGASFLRRDGSVWTTDKDGIIMDLLCAEILARTGHDPAWHYGELTRELGAPRYIRIDAPASPADKARLKKLTPDAVRARELTGEPIVAILTKASGIDIGGLKVIAESGWFAARPSGTEDVYKVYAESFIDDAHLARIVDEAQAMVSAALT